MIQPLFCELSSDAALPDRLELGSENHVSVQMDAPVVFPAELAFVVMSELTATVPPLE